MPVYSERMPGRQFIEMEKLVRLGYNKANKTAWLELRTTDGQVAERFLIGAVYKKSPYGSWGSWLPIQPGDTAGGTLVSLTLNISNSLSDCLEVYRFQEAILKEWTNMQSGFDAAASLFSHGNVNHLAKGTTFGKSFTSASFVAKALKTGFAAIGKPMSAGTKFTTWSIDDLLSYANRRAPAVRGAALTDFKELAPNPNFRGRVEPRRDVDHRDLQLIPATLRGPLRYPYADELQGVKVKGRPCNRVNAYAFRGESRDPEEIRHVGGFLPNYTRPDHIAQHEKEFREALKGKDEAQRKRWMDREKGVLNLEEHRGDPAYKGFISTSKSIGIAKKFATTSGKGNGWVYACLVLGAFEVPQDGGRTYELCEQELAVPGMIDWENVVACRKVRLLGANSAPFLGPVYMRRSLIQSDLKAARKIWKLLSEKKQVD